MKKEKFSIRFFLYFLLYPLLGPFLGFVAFAAVIIGVEWFDGSVTPTPFFGPEGLPDIFWMLPIAYVLGLVQAIVTGIFATKSLRKNGRSGLVESLLVSTYINLAIMIAGAVSFGFGFMMIGIVLISASVFSVLVIKGIEKIFFQRPVTEGVLSE